MGGGDLAHSVPYSFPFFSLFLFSCLSPFYFTTWYLPFLYFTCCKRDCVSFLGDIKEKKSKDWVKKKSVAFLLCKNLITNT